MSPRSVIGAINAQSLRRAWFLTTQAATAEPHGEGGGVAAPPPRFASVGADPHAGGCVSPSPIQRASWRAA